MQRMVTADDERAQRAVEQTTEDMDRLDLVELRLQAERRNRKTRHAVEELLKDYV